MCKCVNRKVISVKPYILWQNILDTQVTVSYTANSEKRVLINLIDAKKKHHIGPLKNKQQLVKALEKAAGEELAEKAKKERPNISEA